MKERHAHELDQLHKQHTLERDSFVPKTVWREMARPSFHVGTDHVEVDLASLGGVMAAVAGTALASGAVTNSEREEQAAILPGLSGGRQAIRKVRAVDFSAPFTAYAEPCVYFLAIDGRSREWPGETPSQGGGTSTEPHGASRRPGECSVAQ